jgi:16S rRNA (cytidine1402-2'-O)-methyltransferase
MSVLYVVGTPIGNLSDFSPRAVETLQAVDFIAAEDTRVTQKLLNHFSIQKPMVSYHEHNLRERGQMILSRIQQGEQCAVVSDAGMPCISDPGEDLVHLCAEAGVPIRVIPGPSAVVSALAISGLTTTRFTFEGFLSTNRKNRIDHLDSLKEEKRTMIFYEAPHKLCATLLDLKEFFGGSRRISLARELTKIYEEVLRFTIEEAIEYYESVKPKGEFVLIVEGKPEQPVTEMTLEDAVNIARERMEKGEKATEAAKAAAKVSPFSKSEIYRNL